jgi:hypothetical protein
MLLHFNKNGIRGISMKKHTRMVQSVCCIMVFLFVCGTLLPVCTAQTNILQTDEEKMFLESPVKKVKHTNNDDEMFFDYALIWGTFENRAFSSLFGMVTVNNNEPWNNRTMNVIGYVKSHDTSAGEWTVKKTFSVKCNFLHIGFVGRHWLCVIGIRNVDTDT